MYVTSILITMKKRMLLNTAKLSKTSDKLWYIKLKYFKVLMFMKTIFYIF